MAQAAAPGTATPAQGIGALARGFGSLGNVQKIGLVVLLAAAIALVVVAFLWARTSEYRVLYSNLSDRDGGEVLAALAQQNVPYRVAEGGSVILVPGTRVYELRLQLAAQGLPKGGAVGFELMDAQKFGISQFAEQVNYQRALAGELSRTIQSMAAVQGARVHLAVPRPSVFVRDRQRPSASVLVGLFPGRALDPGQVSAIQHLVASSVPELEARDVTVVDQAGNLLTSAEGGAAGVSGLDASQVKYLHAIEARFAAAIENIVAPLVGPGNVRAQVTATLDFAQVEQTSETFKPNPTPQEATIRSQQTVETTSVNPQGPTGVPGALSNQPPGAATAPLTAPAAQPQQQAPAQPTNTHRENIVNYEVDKTIRHTKGEVGAVKRLSAAVVVNYRRGTGSDGRPTYTPLGEQELAQITALAREAMGFSQERQDTLNIVNAPFSAEAAVAGVEAPNEWAAEIRQWTSPAGVRSLVLYGGAGIALLIALLLVRSAVRDLTRAGQRPGGGAPIEPQLSGAGAYAAAPEPGYEADLRAVKDIARQEPRVVANVVKDWVGQ
jgi:flagellar M-ring protein FliF